MCALPLRGIASGGRQANLRRVPLPSTCGCMTSARIAAPCFTRPKFEVGLSSRAPQVSAKRVRLSCHIGFRVFSFVRHDEVNVAQSTSSPVAPAVIMLDVFEDSIMDSSQVVLWLHLSLFGQGFLQLFETDRHQLILAASGLVREICHHGTPWQPQA